MSVTQAAISATTIAEAAERIAPMIHRTPMMSSRLFDQQSGYTTFFKCENLQRGGAFKIRGAANFLLSLSPAERQRGVVAYSSGNHAQAVAIAAESLGVSATIVMPLDAPESKVVSTRVRGAKIVQYDRYSEDREVIAKQIATESGAAIAPPFDHEWIVAGAGTAGYEIMQQTEDLDALVVCLGGGGLLAGSAIAAKAANPKIRIFGVEPEAGNDYQMSLKAGYPIQIPTPKTIADGLQTTKPGKVTFPLVQSLVEEVILVSDDELRHTAKFLLTRTKQLVEPSGAAAAAAVLFKKLPAGIQRVAVTISGGNVDLSQIASW
jgi:threonine dehydratase